MNDKKHAPQLPLVLKVITAVTKVHYMPRLKANISCVKVQSLVQLGKRLFNQHFKDFSLTPSFYPVRFHHVLSIKLNVNDLQLR